MKDIEILQALDRYKNGQYFHVKSIKNLDNGVTRISDRVVRKGVAYGNMAANSGRHVRSLPWGHWVPGYENIILEHQGRKYLRVTTAHPDSPNSDVTGVKYYNRNGQEITKTEAVMIGGKNADKLSEGLICNFSFDNILEIK